MKKAGIILGIFFIVIAILLCVFGLKFVNKDTSTDESNTNISENVNNTDVQAPVLENNPQGSEVATQPDTTNNVVETPVETPSPAVTQPSGNTTVVEKVITKEISGVMTIDESGLGEPIVTKEVIVHITNKRIMMIDENTDSTEPKMLTYCFDVLTPENTKLTLFVTNVVYVQYNVGDMLKVNYQVYQNDKGIQFPLVLNVLSVQ